MKKVILILNALLFVLFIYAEDANTLRINVGFGVGRSLYSCTPMSAEDFGKYGYGKSNYFSTEDYDDVYTNETTIGIEYYFSNNFSIYGNFGYLERPFSITYKKKDFAYDVTFFSDYRFLQYSFGMNYYFNWFMIGADFSYNKLLEDNSVIIVGKTKYASAFSESESTTSIALNIGPYFRIHGNKLKIFGRFNFDNSEVFPYDYYVGEVKLVDFSINIATSI
jgi:hypothetical protein